MTAYLNDGSERYGVTPAFLSGLRPSSGRSRWRVRTTDLNESIFVEAENRCGYDPDTLTTTFPLAWPRAR